MGSADDSAHCKGVMFALTEDNEVVALSLVTKGGATRALGSDSYLDAVFTLTEGSDRHLDAVFTLTEDNEVDLVTKGGATRALGSESYLEASTGTRHHFVELQGKTEAIMFLVSVREDEIVDVRRFS